ERIVPARWIERGVIDVADQQRQLFDVAHDATRTGLRTPTERTAKRTRGRGRRSPRLGIIRDGSDAILLTPVATGAQFVRHHCWCAGVDLRQQVASPAIVRSKRLRQDTAS